MMSSKPWGKFRDGSAEFVGDLHSEFQSSKTVGLGGMS